VLFGVRPPFPSFGPGPPPQSPLTARQYGRFNGTVADLSLGLESWNIMWDAVCNILVVAPQPPTAAGAGGGGVAETRTWATLMVSEYDRQVRAIFDCHPSEGASKNRTQILIIHRLY
jgi:hypothetical protein